MQDEIRQAGLSLRRRGEFFAAYQPYAPDARYDADLRLLDRAPQKLRPGQEFPLLVEVTNRCSYPWQPVGLYPTQAGFQMFDSRRMDKPATENYFDLPGVVFPQDRALVTMRIKAPANPGSYLVRLTMIQQRVRWFNAADAARMVQFPVSVE